MLLDVLDLIRNMSGDQWWRTVNGCMAFHASLLLTIRIVHVWKNLSPRMRLLAQSHIFLLAAVVVGSGESMYQGNPTGFRTAMVSASTLWTLWAMLCGGHENYLTEVEPLDRT